ATLLNNGMVLIAGGRNNSGPLAIAELYDPITGTFAFTSSMTIARTFHTATLLNDGMVLMAGGQNLLTGPGVGYLATAELYNPAPGTFTATGSMPNPRSNHTATLLKTGWVLIAGGENSTGYPLATALYDPTGTFIAGGSLNLARPTHTATLLNNGMVLIA